MCFEEGRDHGPSQDSGIRMPIDIWDGERSAMGCCSRAASTSVWRGSVTGLGASPCVESGYKVAFNAAAEGLGRQNFDLVEQRLLF